MNLSQYRVAVKERLGVSTNDGSLPTTWVDGAINGALKHIATTADWPWLFTEEEVTAAAGSGRVFLPPHVTKVLYVASGDGALHLRQAVDVVGSITTGIPTAYAPVGNDLFIRPAPDTTTTLRVGAVRTESLLVVDTDAPLLPDAYSEWLISEAAVRVAVSTNNADRLANLREEAAVAKRAALDNARRSAGLPAIRRTKPSVWPQDF